MTNQTINKAGRHRPMPTDAASSAGDTPATTPTAPNHCVSAAALTARGWTTTAIRTFLGEPDRTAPNPFYRQAAPMRLTA